MYDFGTIVLVPFPCTDLSSKKLRPALIVSEGNDKRDDIILCFITSRVEKIYPHSLVLQQGTDTGLKRRSAVLFDKIATLDKGIILGEIGTISPQVLKKQKKTFFDVFGF